jgi:peptide/nickel transport system substrate-binding protein
VNQPHRVGVLHSDVPRRRVLTGLAGVGAVAGAGSLLAACSSSTPKPSASGSQSKRKGGNLQVGMTGGSSSDTLDPHQSITYLDGARAQALYDPLVQLGPNAADIQYLLASEISPRDAKGTQWVIRIRPGIKFHDGTSLTATDVVYTLQRIIKNKYSPSSVLGPVDETGIKTLDSLTVLIPMTRPFTTLPEQLASGFSVQVVPAGFTSSSRPNGTGPFMYRSFTPGQRSVFTRNPHYWQHGVPYVDTLTIIDFPGTVSLADALMAGQVQAVGTLDPPQIPQLSTTSGINVVVSPAGAIVPFTMRVDQPPFNDVRVRQAMRLLAGRPQMIDSALDSYGTTASDVFSPYDPDFDHSLVRYQDIPQAKFLLKQAGKEDLKVTLVTSDIATGAIAMATVLAEQAQAAGVTITINNVPSGTFFGSDYLQWTFAQDFYYYNAYVAQVAQCMLPTSPWNETHNSDSRYINLYNQANATTNEGLRKEIVYQMQQYDFNNGGYIIPAFVSTLDAYSTTVTGYGKSLLGKPLGDYAFTNIAFTG